MFDNPRQQQKKKQNPNKGKKEPNRQHNTKRKHKLYTDQTRIENKNDDRQKLKQYKRKGEKRRESNERGRQ